MIYEIGNPSDPYTCDIADFKTAAVMICLLGNGRFYLKPTEPGGEEVPPFILGGHDKWFMEKFGVNFESALMSVGFNDLADAFDSVLIGNVRDRELLEDTLKKIPIKADAGAFKEGWISSKVTSMNDIGEAAKEWANKLRKKHQTMAAEVT